MEQTVWSYLALVGIVGLGYLAMRSLGVQMREAVAELKPDDASVTAASLASDLPGLVARMEALELRMAEVADNAKRHYQKGNQQISRARRLMGEPEDEEPEIDADEAAQMQSLVQVPTADQISPAERAPMKPLAWKMRRAMGNGA